MKKEEKNKLDIRNIRLCKCNIPKNSDILSNNFQLAIGYFDMVETKQVETSPGNHPLFDAYQSSYRCEENAESLMEDYTIQELFVFTNVGEHGFDSEKITQFWNKQFDICFISMIHVDNEIMRNGSNELDNIIDRINTVFEKKDYLYYYSFDYSGIVVFAQNMKVQEYVSCLFKLNYTLIEQKKLIRDSFSLFGIKVNAQNGESRSADYWKETYIAVTNIGILNYQSYKNFLTELHQENLTEYYGLLGRKDVSIVNSNADLNWLISLQHLLEKYTSKDQRAFYSYETFIKVNLPNDEFKISEKEEKEEKEIETKREALYQEAKEQLSKKYNKLKEAFNSKDQKKQYNGEYLAPLEAVKYSILSILRNGFAEDFVLCIYQSFLEFLDYLAEKVLKEQEDISQFDETFNEYFRVLNSLVNSAMHSERQFVQATAFNAIIYDIPAKIMAFYTAIIQEMQEIVKDNNKDKKYTFILTPSFSNEISVNVISYKKEKPPHNRILRVSINEQTLYRPNAVMYRMAHEVAHYVGDDLRCRDSRKNYLVSSIVHLLLCYLIPKCLYNEDLEKLNKTISKSLIRKYYPLEEKNYSESLYSLAGGIIGCFYISIEIREMIQEYIEKSIQEMCSEQRKEFKQYFVSMYQYLFGETGIMFQKILNKQSFTKKEKIILSNIIVSDIYAEIGILNISENLKELSYNCDFKPSSISGIGDGYLNQVTLGFYTSKLVSIYAEAFADMQMILLLNLTYEQYIVGFVCEEGINVDMFESDLEDSMRIGVVAKFMDEIGFWELCVENRDSKCMKNERVKELDEKIRRKIQIVRNTMEILDPDQKMEKLREDVLKFQENTGGQSKKSASGSARVFETELCDPLVSPLWLRLENYLLECLEKTIVHYNKQSDDIKKLRNTVSVIEKSRDIKEMFCKICQEISKYKRKLFPETFSE